MEANGTIGNRLIEHDLKMQAAGRANADPFPGPLKAAFCEGDIKIGKWTVRKAVAYDNKVFTIIKSPLLELIQSARQNPSAPASLDISDQQQWELCYQFTRSAKEVREILSKGIEAFSAAAELEFMECNPGEIIMLQKAVQRQLELMWETAVKFGVQSEKESGITFFPDSGKTPMMEAAGS